MLRELFLILFASRETLLAVGRLMAKMRRTLFGRVGVPRGMLTILIEGITFGCWLFILVVLILILLVMALVVILRHATLLVRMR